MTDSWTDARLDDYAKHVDKRFDAMDKHFDAMFQASVLIIVALIGLIATQL